MKKCSKNGLKNQVKTDLKGHRKETVPAARPKEPTVHEPNPSWIVGVVFYYNMWRSCTHMLHGTGIFTYMFHTFMMVGKYYMEHLAYMIDFWYFLLTATAVPWISMVFYSPFRVLKIQRRTTVKSRGPNDAPGMQRKIVRDGTCDTKYFSRNLSSVMWFFDVRRWVIYLVDVWSKLALIFLDEKQAKDVSFEFGRCMCI